MDRSDLSPQSPSYDLGELFNLALPMSPYPAPRPSPNFDNYFQQAGNDIINGFGQPPANNDHIPLVRR